MTIGEFERGQDKKNWPVPTTDTTPSLDEFDEALSVDITVIGQYIRSLDGKIQVTSQPGTGTIFSLELAFEHPSLPKRREPRKISPPTPRTSRSHTPPTPSPPLRSANPVHRENRRRGDLTNNEAQAFWKQTPRSSSLPPPSDKALPARPIRHDHGVDVPSPLRVSPPNTIHETINNEINRHSSSNLNILIADDDPVSLRMLEEGLTQRGHSVDVASDGQECHDRFAGNADKIDLILMDLKVISPTSINSRLLLIEIYRRTSYFPLLDHIKLTSIRCRE
jgi:CheY-like chemotaxis protein